jgi:hypothetical protein
MVWHIEAWSAADYFGPKAVRNYEDGFWYHEWPEGFVVVGASDYGNEYIHGHTFKTLPEAEKFAIKVQGHLLDGGLLNLDHWVFQRVQYGSQAYIDQEPYIVAREREDDLNPF